VSEFRRRGGRLGAEPPIGGERDDHGDGLTDLQIERRLTRLETHVGLWRWALAIAIGIVGVAVGVVGILARVLT